jgi:hypothetical protein
MLFNLNTFTITSSMLNFPLNIFYLSIRNNDKVILFHLVKGEKIYDSFLSFINFINKNTDKASSIQIIYNCKNNNDLSFILVDSFIIFLNNPDNKFIYIKQFNTLLIEGNRISLIVKHFDYYGYINEYSKI